MPKAPKSKKVTKLENKLNKRMAKANKTRVQLEKARAVQRADGSFSDNPPS